MGHLCDSSILLRLLINMHLLDMYSWEYSVLLLQYLRHCWWQKCSAYCLICRCYSTTLPKNSKITLSQNILINFVSVNNETIKKKKRGGVLFSPSFNRQLCNILAHELHSWKSLYWPSKCHLCVWDHCGWPQLSQRHPVRNQ